MAKTRVASFSAHAGGWRLDPVDELLWHGAAQIRLPPRAFAMLRYLVENPNRLLTKQELLQRVWPNLYVTEALIKDYVQDLRKVLGDDAKAPRFIETVRGRGYRFIGPIALSGAETPEQSMPHAVNPAPTQYLPGRGAELAQLQNSLARAAAGKRQIVFISGEAGIGKTALIDAFIQSQKNDAYYLACGHCLDFHGRGEAYMPVLDALEDLCQGADGDRIVQYLFQHAPLWLMQLPALQAGVDMAELQRRTQGASPERMMRELAQAIEVLSKDRVLILWLEDLHWVDNSTLDLITYLAQRRHSAQLLLIGTYRSADVRASRHPLISQLRELSARGACHEIALALLSADGVAEFLIQQYPGLPKALAQPLYELTDGNPLYLTNVIDQLRSQNMIRRNGGRWVLQEDPQQLKLSIPPSLRILIEQRLEHLPLAQQQLLQAASVIGFEFSALAIAAGLQRDAEAVEADCAGLVRNEQFLRAAGETAWPDGSISGRYAFSHALYEEVLYAGIPPAQRARLHQQIGERIEAAYASQPAAVAVLLARHFEQSLDIARAVRYAQLAAEQAANRYAYREALVHLDKGLNWLTELPPGGEKLQRELKLQVAKADALMATQGFAAAETGAAFDRARELCLALGDPPEIFLVLFGLFSFYLTQAEPHKALAISEEYLCLAQVGQDAEAMAQSHWRIAISSFFLGRLGEAREHFERAIALSESQSGSAFTQKYGLNAKISALIHAPPTFTVLGYCDQARAAARQAMEYARQSGNPQRLALATALSGFTCALQRDFEACLQFSKRLLNLAREHELADFVVMAQGHKGWALANLGERSEGIKLTQESLEAQSAAGYKMRMPLRLGLLAEAQALDGKLKQAGNNIDKALALTEQTGERWTEAELLRIKGDILALANEADPQDCWRQALKIARSQQARLWELRAAVSLARWLKNKGERQAALAVLQPVYAWFSEGFECTALKEAAQLLAGLQESD